MQGFTKGAEDSMIAHCRQTARLFPGRVFLVARTPSGTLCTLPMADLPEGDRWEVLYSTFSGACAVC